MNATLGRDVIYNGNLPAGVTDADCGRYSPDAPKLSRFLDGDIPGRVTAEELLASFYVKHADEIVNRLAGLIGKPDAAKVAFVNDYLAELELCHEQLNG